MNGIFTSTNLNVAVWLLASGHPMPEITSDNGRATFEFADPSGEVRRAALSLDLHNTVDDVCSVPVARIFAAQRILRDALNEKLGTTRRRQWER